MNPTVGSTSASIPKTDRQMRMLRRLGNDQAIISASLPVSFESSGTEMAEAQYSVWEIFAKKKELTSQSAVSKRIVVVPRTRQLTELLLGPPGTGKSFQLLFKTF